MVDLNDRISESLDIVIDNEVLIGDELRDMLKNYKAEKTDVGYSFGQLCVLHYEAFTNHFNEDIYRVAAAIELLILSFDIIDDLQDQDTENSWCKTPDLSLNTAISMLFMASKTIRESSFEHKGLAVQLLEKYALLSINGQQLDLLNSCRDEQSYIEMTEQKSGSLTSMSCLIGEVLAKGEVSTQVKEYSTYIGIIQQIKNDIQDLKKWDSKNDLLNKKYTLPIIFLFSTKNEVSKIVQDYYNGNIVTFLDNSVIENELTSGGAIRYAIAVKNLYKYKSLHIINDVSMKKQSKELLIHMMK